MKIDLWERDIPYYNEAWGDAPCLTPFPCKGAKSCVIIAPGGGYENRCHDREGEPIAEYFNQNGISAFVLDYRVAPYDYHAIREDVLRAVRVVRREAKTYGYDENKIAVSGFSAGGHLASMAVTQFDYGRDNGDETDRISSRPDLGILCYPVLTMGAFTHEGSRRNLLGDHWQDEALAEKFSAERNVREDTPPCFLFHTAEDSLVPVENTLQFANQLMAKKIPVEMHIFPYGYHGMGKGLDEYTRHAGGWIDLAVKYIHDYLEK